MQWDRFNRSAHISRSNSRRRRPSIEVLETRLCLAAIGDRVWSDVNGDGLQAGGEPGIPGIEVRLFPEGGQNPVQTTSTDANGRYRFNQVESGRYTIEVVPPARWQVTRQYVGGNRGRDSDAGPDGLIGPFEVSGDMVNMDFDVGVFHDGFVAGAAVGNRVWHDTNGNGLQDFGESGVEGVRVELLAEGGTRVLRTVRTGASGGFNFRDVVPGRCVMRVLPPSNWTFTHPNRGGREGLDSDADTNGILGPFTLTEGQSDIDWDAGLLAPDYVDQAMIGDRIWEDTNGDGRQNTGEPAVSGVTLQLFADGLTTPIQTTTSDASGRYRFRGLAPGTYRIQVTPPAGWDFTIAGEGGRRGGDSDVDPQGMMGPITVSAGQLDFDWDVGLRLPGSGPPGGLLPETRIGDVIWNDLDGDGLHGSREPGIPHVLVRLWKEGFDAPVQTATSDANGNYHFQPGTAGNYTLQFVPPIGWSFTAAHQGYSRSLDSDADTAGLIGPFPVEIGRRNSDLDVGLLAPGFQAPGRVEGFVWSDWDASNTLGTGDRPATGVEVVLYDSNSNQPVFSTTTDAGGVYRMRNLQPGSYFIEVVAPDGWNFADAGLGWSRSRNSDADQNGRIGPFNLSAGEFKSDLDALLQPPNALRPGEIGNRVWNDRNGDGKQGASEPGVSGVQVRLLPDGSNTPSATVTTDRRGTYRFDRIAPGTYFVEVVPPSGWSVTTPLQGGGRSDDSDADASGRMGPIVLSEGDLEWDWDVGLIEPNFISPARVGNRVWNDVNGNGIQDPAEPGVPGVQVQLLTMGVPGPWKTRRTDANGFFTFGDLPSDTYQLQIVPPAAWSFTLPDQGNDDNRDSDADLSGRTPPVMVAAGAQILNWDAGLRIAPGYLAQLTLHGAEIKLAPTFSPTQERYAVYTGPSSGALSLTLYAGIRAIC